MAEAFCDQLPRVGRGVLDKENQQCPICMSDYGTTPSESGVIERAVRLPCKHIIGSECISIWLTQSGGATENNTCPFCRHVLFEIPQSPPMSPSRVEHMRIHRVLSDRCVGLSAQLDLHSDIMRLARGIANRFHDRVTIEGVEVGDGPVHVVAAASIYMASHILGDARSLELVSSCDGVEVEAVRAAYGSLHGSRHALLSNQMLHMEWDEIEEGLPSVTA